MTTPARTKLLELYKLSCNIFSQTFNPNNTRTGASALRGKLKGPALQNYYRSEEAPSLSEFRANFSEFTLRTREDAHHEKMLKLRRKRGKGAPKKKNAPPEPKGGKKR